jgi:crotonobetainyl-CoA:carnitine CoA-transferase CaiB-like acyl-CoA transferase
LTGGSPRYAIYRTSDGRFLTCSPLEDAFWRRFCDAIGLDARDRDDARGDGAVRERIAAILARGTAAREALAPFARGLLRRGAFAWALAFVIAALPIARFAVVSGGASLFHSP